MIKTMGKLLNAAKGLGLGLTHIKVFNLDYFRSKRIAIVGPANSAFNTGRGTYIDDFDVVVRMNKSPMTVAEGTSVADIGRRTDVLFHCFHESPHGGGGPLDFELYRRLGIKYVINPRNEWSGLRNSYNYYKKYVSATNTYVLPRSLYVKISESVSTYRPTTGYSALYSILETNFSELYITGFTFFKTAYGSGYRDVMKEAHQAQSFIKQVGLHNPDAELQGFKKILEKNKTKNVVTDAVLKNILENN